MSTQLKKDGFIEQRLDADEVDSSRTKARPRGNGNTGSRTLWPFVLLDRKDNPTMLFLFFFLKSSDRATQKHCD